MILGAGMLVSDGQAPHFRKPAPVSKARTHKFRCRRFSGVAAGASILAGIPVREATVIEKSALAPRTLWSMAKASVTAWIDDFAPSMGAAIAYYTVFSIAPLLVIVIAIAGFFFGADAASGYLYAQIGSLLGEPGAAAIRDMVERAEDTGEGVIATTVGAVLLVIGATTVFAELQSSLDRVWKAPAAKKSEGLWGLIRSRLLSLGLVVSIGFVMLVSLVLSAVLSAFGEWWGGVLDDMEWLFHILDLAVSLVVITVLFALMYKILPRVKISWRDVWIGAFATAVLFTIGKYVVGVYLGKSDVASGFGAAGSLAVLLVWVYYSAQIFLLGAEFTWVYAHRFGSRRGEERPATAKEAVATEARPEGGHAPRPPVTHTPVAPPAPANGLVAVVREHPVASAGGALVVGALVGEVLNLVQRRPSRLLRR
jgi:membrane protein